MKRTIENKDFITIYKKAKLNNCVYNCNCIHCIINYYQTLTLDSYNKYCVYTFYLKYYTTYYISSPKSKPKSKEEFKQLVKYHQTEINKNILELLFLYKNGH